MCVMMGEEQGNWIKLYKCGLQEADEKLLIHHVSRETGKPELELLAGISGAFRPKILTGI